MAAAGTIQSGVSTKGASMRTPYTTTNPLMPSPTSVSSAAALLPVRSTFVAPGFPDPYSCGSGKPNALLTTTANDTDPIRYAATTSMQAASTGSFGKVE